MTDAPKKSFVLYSTPESIKAGAVSLLAVAEVIGSVIGFWMLYHWLGTYWPLMISLFAAPFILLRSDEGTEMAVRMWERWEKASNEVNWRDWQAWLIILISFYFSWYAGHLLIKNYGWEIFGPTIIIYPIVSMNMGVMGIVAGGIAITRAGTGTGRNAIPVHISFITCWLGIAVGAWLRALWMRFSGTVRNFRVGLAQAPDNWQRLMWTEDAAHLPELIPGAGDKADNAATIWREGYSLTESLIYKLIAIIWLIPALMWRYSFKATIWVYWPLMIAITPGKFSDETERKLWICAEPNKIQTYGYMIAWLSLALSAITAAGLGVKFMEELPPGFKSIGVILAFGGEEFPIPILSALYITNIAQILATPWHIPLTLACVSAILIHMGMSKHRVRWKAAKDLGEPYDLSSRAIWRLAWASRFQLACIAAYVMLLGYHILAYLNNAEMLTLLPEGARELLPSFAAPLTLAADNPS